jgi:4-alpha-glucanotransferase
VREYARFRAVYDRLGVSWEKWPERLRGGRIRPEDYDAAAENYHSYAQWAAQRQMNELVENYRRKGLRLYLDLPLGVNRNGFDVWREQEVFACEANAGAPPDMFFSKGQNWGFPPVMPERLRQTRYQHVIEYLRFQMRHAGMLRIDHVMGLHRLYWIPPGFSAEAGAYVRYPAEELHAVVCLESHRNRCEIIGENLGTVPAEVNQAMDRHGHGRMYVVQFEQQAKKEALRPPAENTVASLDTHDTPTFTAHWRGLDIPFRAKLGLLRREQIKKERATRKKLNLWTLRFLRRKGLLAGGRSETPAVMNALVRWLGKSQAKMVLVSLEDLWGETRPQNVPGTMTEYPNWSRKAKMSLEDTGPFS